MRSDKIFLPVNRDRASGETCCLAHHIWNEDGQPTLMVISIRYPAKFVRFSARMVRHSAVGPAAFPWWGVEDGRHLCSRGGLREPGTHLGAAQPDVDPRRIVVVHSVSRHVKCVHGLLGVDRQGAHPVRCRFVRHRCCSSVDREGSSTFALRASADWWYRLGAGGWPADGWIGPAPAAGPMRLFQWRLRYYRKPANARTRRAPSAVPSPLARSYPGTASKPCTENV